MNISVSTLASMLNDNEREEMLRLLLEESRALALWFIGDDEDKEGLVEAHELVIDFVSVVKGNG